MKEGIIMNRPKMSETEQFIEQFNMLDVIDKARVQERIETLLDDEKYSVKRKITNRQGNIIKVNFG